MGDNQNWDQYFKANTLHWNAMTEVNVDSDFYDLPSFIAGRNSLRQIELDGLGEGIAGKSLLHLQCHFGQDTLSWARMGAQVTGVDMSPQAIAKARELRDTLGIEASFVCCNVYDLPSHLEGQFDIVFASYGVIGWLPDVAQWARVGAQFLKPGGQLFLAEFHPYIWMYDSQFQTIEHAYFNRKVIAEPSGHSYADPDQALAEDLMEYGWNHPLSDVINGFIQAGLQIESLHEYDYSPWPCFPNLREDGPQQWVFEHFGRKIPYVYALKATK